MRAESDLLARVFVILVNRGYCAVLRCRPALHSAIEIWFAFSRVGRIAQVCLVSRMMCVRVRVRRGPRRACAHS